MEGNNNYLIPANSKKSMLILSFFTPLDLMIFSIGCIVTVILLFVANSNNVIVLVGILMPALVSAFLVLPIPNYHNVLTFIGVAYRYFSTRKRYYWKGWCVAYDKESDGK